ncbi:MAG: methylenetetrahydrofolate reductase C-terminal domain-containing protein [Endomicrobiales bacterium]|nr:methylenetetrahydrofolate reductase C-terminal domain-containing protein [Endomicrobiales bacterium]
MIITVQKPLEEIIESLKQYKKIFVVGCAACATKCQTGGEEAVKKMADDLKKNKKEVTGYKVLDTPCDVRIVKKDLSRLPEVKAADALLIMACGGGVQAVERVIDMPLYPSLNPVFLGTIERIGIYNEFCKICGDCILAETGGICPISRCPKGMLNGPCGGAVEGKCEVDRDNDCVWVLIFEKNKKKNVKEGILKKYMAPKTYSKPVKLNNKEKK